MWTPLLKPGHGRKPLTGQQGQGCFYRNTQFYSSAGQPGALSRECGEWEGSTETGKGARRTEEAVIRKTQSNYVL